MINIIVAVDEKNGIGKNGSLPWHISEDLKRFRQITTGHPVIMGRKTFESIGKPLTNRKNIVISSNANYIQEGVEIASSLDEALEKAGEGETFVIGGGQVFQEALAKTDKIYLTKVKGDFNCDTFFPDFSQFSKETFIGAGEENGITYTFSELEKETP